MSLIVVFSNSLALSTHEAGNSGQIREDLLPDLTMRVRSERAGHTCTLFIIYTAQRVILGPTYCCLRALCEKFSIKIWCFSPPCIHYQSHVMMKFLTSNKLLRQTNLISTVQKKKTIGKYGHGVIFSVVL